MPLNYKRLFSHDDTLIITLNHGRNSKAAQEQQRAFRATCCDLDSSLVNGYNSVSNIIMGGYDRGGTYK